MLAPIVGWFTEGFDSPDLKDAAAQLASLGCQLRLALQLQFYPARMTASGQSRRFRDVRERSA